MYVDGNLQGPYGERRKISGLPTLLFTVCSVIKDVSNCITMDAKQTGDLVYVLGKTFNELGGSEYYQMMGTIGLHGPVVHADRSMKGYKRLHMAIKKGLLSSCHAVSRGGLGVHFALVSIGGDVGLDIFLEQIPADPGLRISQTLYSESCGRFVVTVPPEEKDAFEACLEGIEMAQVGHVSGSHQLRMMCGPQCIMEEDVDALCQAWKKPFGDLI
jgi:phosphoribosylformylglycinamidine synthase